MKKFWDEFKAFALKGNMMDMAIGVIIGGAFSTLVTSLTDNLISPILGILGKVNFDSMMWDVFGDGQLVFKYGAFITSVINFLIMAFVLFMIVKSSGYFRLWAVHLQGRTVCARGVWRQRRILRASIVRPCRFAIKAVLNIIKLEDII